MTPRQRAVGLQRHELLRAFTVLDNGRGWSLLRLSAYTAHGLYRYGAVFGHVIGTASGWWWAIQVEPGRVPSPVRAPGPAEACLAARGAVRRFVLDRDTQAKSLRETLADTAGMGDT